ncbi:hypothetical protein, partial [Microbacterium trichothecenolyticum]
PQFSAVLETAEAARIMGAHVWADGGVREPPPRARGGGGGHPSFLPGRSVHIKSFQFLRSNG